MSTLQVGSLVDSPLGTYGGGFVTNEEGTVTGFWDLNPEVRWLMTPDPWEEEEDLEWERLERLEAQGAIKMAQLDSWIDWELDDDPPPSWWVLGYDETYIDELEVRP